MWNTIEIIHIIEVIIQAVGVGFLVFKVGRYIGESSQMFRQITADLEKISDRLDNHIKHDEVATSKLNEELTDLKVMVAGMPTPRRRE